MLVESDPGYSRKIIVNLSLLTTGTFIYECVFWFYVNFLNE
jgi:hypothetical protein